MLMSSVISTGMKSITIFTVKISDFIEEQQSFLSLYQFYKHNVQMESDRHSDSKVVYTKLDSVPKWNNSMFTIVISDHHPLSTQLATSHSDASTSTPH